MPKNNNLQTAKNAQYDEFYTQIEDIEKELKHYVQHFKNKVVYCNCDNPYESNFVKYFIDNFKTLKLKALICSSFNPNGKGLMGRYNKLSTEIKKRYFYTCKIKEAYAPHWLLSFLTQ